MQNFINQYRNTLSLDECNQIISWMDSKHSDQIQGKLGSPGVVDLTRKSSRDLELSFMEKNPVNELIAGAVMQSISKYKEQHPELEIHLPEWSAYAGYNIQKYFPNNAYYATHCEHGPGDASSRRVLAWMIYLNTIKKGGGTEFPILRKKIKAETGKCVIWPSGWTHMHRGIVAPDETKYITTGWFSYVISEEKNQTGS